MAICDWCGREFDSSISCWEYNGCGSYCSRRCVTAYENSLNEDEYRYEQEQRAERARRESAAREEERLEAERDRRDAEQERLRVEQQRLEEEQDAREHNKLISDIERDLSAYNITDITGAENIYDKIVEMVEFFCKKNQNYTVPQVNMDYLKAVLYKFGSDTKSLNRFFAERDDVILSSVRKYLDNQHIQMAETIETQKLDDFIKKQISNVRNYPLLVEFSDYKKTVEKELKSRFAPYQTEAYKQMSNDLNGTQWGKKFNHIALLSFLNNTKEFINTQLNECCHSYQDAAREGFFLIAAKKISSYQKDIRDFIDQYISKCVDLGKLKSSDNKYKLMTEAGRFELRCNDGDGTKEEVEDVFVKLLAEKLGLTDLTSLDEMREWENKRIAERPQMFEQMRKEKQAAKEKKESDEQALRDKFNIKNKDFIVVEKEGMDTFAICSHPVTVSEISMYKNNDNPVSNISWYEAIAYCNRRSRKEKLTPCYKLVKQGLSYTVEWNRKANGYRLPTIDEQLAVGNNVPIHEWCWDEYSSTYDRTLIHLKKFYMCYVELEYSSRHIYTKPGQKKGSYDNYESEIQKKSDLGFRVVRSCIK